MHAGSPRSSQALCLSAWHPLRGLEARHAVIERLLAASLPAAVWPGGAAGPPADPADGPAAASRAALAPAARRWEIAVEVRRPEVLDEAGGAPSAIDVLLTADDAVVCVEAKYLSDAVEGFGRCTQFPGACAGFHGPGSDLKTGSAAPCRLAVSEGRRQARRYWEVAARLFLDAATAEGDEVGSCALARPYQLARDLFFAAELARRGGKPRFAALVVAPAATAAVVTAQTAAFAADVLRPEHAGRVAVVHYEALSALLLASGDAHAEAVGRFVAERLPAPRPAARSVPVRELRRRAEAARRHVARGPRAGHTE